VTVIVLLLLLLGQLMVMVGRGGASGYRDFCEAADISRGLGAARLARIEVATMATGAESVGCTRDKPAAVLLPVMAAPKTYGALGRWASSPGSMPLRTADTPFKDGYLGADIQATTRFSVNSSDKVRMQI
jgi:hypothetical protein